VVVSGCYSLVPGSGRPVSIGSGQRALESIQQRSSLVTAKPGPDTELRVIHAYTVTELVQRVA
jgi:hypothetical protein